jgi:hypothetical protein
MIREREAAMQAIRRVMVIVGVLLTVSAWPGMAQDAAVAASRPTLTTQEMERFLANGDILATISVSKGATKARRVRMSDGRLTHDAQVQDVDEAKAIFEVDPKHTEVNFKDSYRYNIAAYRLSVLLGLDNVPMSIERMVDRKPVAVTWWIDDVMMEEGDRRKKKTYGPNPTRTIGYMGMMQVFDELIQNRDRNLGNMVWTTDWKLWMIDHTRAFRTGKDLLTPNALMRCERALFDKLKTLTAEQLTEVMGKTLLKDEIQALIVRRDKIVKLIESRVAENGEAKTLYSLQ